MLFPWRECLLSVVARFSRLKLRACCPVGLPRLEATCVWRTFSWFFDAVLVSISLDSWDLELVFLSRKTSSLPFFSAL